DLAHLRRRPPFLVEGTLLAARCRDAHDAPAVPNGLRHQPRGEIRLVVGMGPHAEDGPEVHHRADVSAPGRRGFEAIAASAAAGSGGTRAAPSRRASGSGGGSPRPTRTAARRRAARAPPVPAPRPSPGGP